MKIYLGLILFSFLSSFYAHADTNEIDHTNDSVVVIVEHDFYKLDIDDKNYIKPTGNTCHDFIQYNENSEWNKYAAHGRKVVDTFLTESSGVKIIALAIDPSARLTTSDVIEKFYRVFDCITEISLSYRLVGVNFSVASVEIIKANLNKEQLIHVNNIEKIFKEKVFRFLTSNPNTTLMMAMGNEPQRLESVAAFPLTPACISPDSPQNLFCITLIWNSKYRLNANKTNPVNLKIGAYEFQYFQEPDGSGVAPFPIITRFSKSNRLVATQSEYESTSLATPSLLARYLSSESEIKTGFGTAINDSLNSLNVFPIKYIRVYKKDTAKEL